MYTPEPLDKEQFKKEFDRSYSRFAKAYDLAVKAIPVWGKWIKEVLPHIVGPKVLEVSFGTGYLLTQYARSFKTFGIDYNWELICTAKQNLQKADVQASLLQADVEYLPYPAGMFDTVLNTMAFSGYPDGLKAMAQIARVMKDDGRLVMVDINYPKDGNWLGMNMARMWASSGDIIRDMKELLDLSGLTCTNEEVGGFGSVHLYIATKKTSTSSSNSPLPQTRSL